MPERRCPCGTRLSRYNDGLLCFACDDREARESWEAEVRAAPRPRSNGRITEEEWDALLAEKLGVST